MQTTKPLPQEAVEEFKKLYKAKFNKELSNQEAIKRANNLFSLYESVYGSSTNKTRQRRDTDTL
ncbi:hypothetical protein HYT74_00110 [Candidatus Daviesbacteria bacterium]|nr:hypothetical protein [Candidatus Daviesbacteria bacterium]